MTTASDNDESPPRNAPTRAMQRGKPNKLAEAKKTAARRVLKKATATVKAAKRANQPTTKATPKPLMSVKTTAPPSRHPVSLMDGISRKPKPSSDTAALGVKKGWRKLYVGDLRTDVTLSELRVEFGRFGLLNDIWLARNPPGFGFVDYVEPRDAARAVRVLDGAHVLGSTIKVEFAKKLNPRAAAMVALVRRRNKSRGSTARNETQRGRRTRNRSPSDRRSDHWSHRRSVSPYSRRSPLTPPPPPPPPEFYPPPPLPPLPPAMFDPRFRELALRGWSRGRSPPPAFAALPPRYRSRSPSPSRYGSRSRRRRYCLTTPG